jgi:hypothetical protein
MLKAASLFYATVISLIIAIISSSLLLFSFFNNQEKLIYSNQERIYRNVISGIRLIMASDTLLSEDQKSIIDLFGNKADSVALQSIAWGGFKVALSIAYSGNKKCNKAAIYGIVPDTINKSALYLVDNGKPLTLCGKTFIKGTCYLPKAGIKRGYIEGKNFEGDELVYGLIKQSNKALPVVSKKIIERLKSVYTKKGFQDDSVINYTGGISNDSLTNSFFSKTIAIYSHDKIIINSGEFCSGNIIIHSDTEIEVEQHCKMQDIILTAPIVKIKDSFTGNIQVFASDSICIGAKCVLQYPSLLTILKEKINNSNSVIKMEPGSSISGNIFAYNGMQSTQTQVLVCINEKDTVIGSIYSNGNVDLKGLVYGNITCNQIMLKTTNSEYEGYLMDATIDCTKLSKYFVYADLLPAKKKSIVKWVY